MITGDDLALFERSLRGAVERHSGAALDAALVDLGWRDALADDPRAAVATLFELQGRHGVTSSALDAVLADRLGLAGAGSLGVGEAPGGGASAGPVVLPALGSTAAPGRQGSAGLEVRGIATAAAATAEALLVVVDRSGDGGDAGAGSGGSHDAVRVAASALACRSIEGLDPALGLVEVRGSGVSGDLVPITGAWDDAVAVAQLAVAHELVGASRTMVQFARDHAVDRIQFGQPIAAFQAVRHRLADSLVAVEGADGAAAAAWEESTPFAAAVAKAVAGRNARLVARHAHQVLAGIGFTTDHDLHHYVRRVLVLDRVLGDARSLTKRLGEQLLEARAVPAILPL